jgi:ASC-1-like (ASCH) protein
MAAATHYLELPESQIEMIQKGKKIMDARPIAGIYGPILVGDHIRYNRDSEVTVNKINTYGSMKELIDHEGWENIVPNAADKDDAYRQILAGLAPGEEKLPAKAIYYVSMEGHWFKYWFRAAGKEQV